MTLKRFAHLSIGALALAASCTGAAFAQASDAAGAPPSATAERAGGFWRMASALVGHDAECIAPSLLLALHQNPLRPGHCQG